MARFVIIDDSMVMRTVLRYLLERCGATVLAEGKDGAEALTLARELQPDAISLAVSLRGETGLAVLAKLRQTAWTGKVFYAASSAQTADIAAARQAGVDGVLLKPFALEQVSAEVRQLMAQGDSP